MYIYIYINVLYVYINVFYVYIMYIYMEFTYSSPNIYIYMGLAWAYFGYSVR